MPALHQLYICSLNSSELLNVKRKERIGSEQNSIRLLLIEVNVVQCSCNAHN